MTDNALGADCWEHFKRGHIVKFHCIEGASYRTLCKLIWTNSFCNPLFVLVINGDPPPSITNNQGAHVSVLWNRDLSVCLSGGIIKIWRYFPAFLYLIYRCKEFSDYLAR